MSQSQQHTIVEFYLTHLKLSPDIQYQQQHRQEQQTQLEVIAMPPLEKISPGAAMISSTTSLAPTAVQTQFGVLPSQNLSVPSMTKPLIKSSNKKKRKHMAHSRPSGGRKCKQCVCCKKLMKKRQSLEAEWGTGICQVCQRLKQAKLLLDMAIQYEHTTPKVLLPADVRFA